MRVCESLTAFARGQQRATAQQLTESNAVDRAASARRSTCESHAFCPRRKVEGRRVAGPVRFAKLSSAATLTPAANRAADVLRSWRLSSLPCLKVGITRMWVWESSEAIFLTCIERWAWHPTSTKTLQPSLLIACSIPVPKRTPSRACSSQWNASGKELNVLPCTVETRTGASFLLFASAFGGC